MLLIRLALRSCRSSEEIPKLRSVMSALSDSPDDTLKHKAVPWVNLGSSGLKVSQFILGCMSFGSEQWFPTVVEKEEEVFEIMKSAYDHGIRTFDTADMYSNGQSEILIGKFLQKYNIKRDKVVIMTKICNPMDEEYGPGFSHFKLGGLPAIQKVDFENNQGLSRKHIMDGVQGSVRRLGTYIDVYQVHKYDNGTPIEETMRALNDCVEKGWVRYIGASNMKAVQFVEMQHVADKNGWSKFINMQSRYNLIERADEDEMNYYCNKTGVGLTPYFALAAGKLSRPLPPDETHRTPREEVMSQMIKPLSLKDKGSEFEADCEIILRVEELAKKKDATMAGVALSWLVAKGCIPLVGISSVPRLLDLVNAAGVTLTEDEVKYLEEPYKPKLRATF